MRKVYLKYKDIDPNILCCPCRDEYPPMEQVYVLYCDWCGKTVPKLYPWMHNSEICEECLFNGRGFVDANNRSNTND